MRDHSAQEFFSQGDLEQQLGIPVTPMMDRTTACIPKQQLGFYDFVVRPMFESLDLVRSIALFTFLARHSRHELVIIAKVLPMSQQLSNLESMYEYWTERLPENADINELLAPRRALLLF